MPIRILIVDDSAVFRASLRAALKVRPEWEICGEAEDGCDAVEKNRLLAPDLIVMDFSMPRSNGIDAACDILRASPRVPILLLSLHLTNQLEEHARSAGIRASLSKSAMEDLVGTIDAILIEEKGRRYVRIVGASTS